MDNFRAVKTVLQSGTEKTQHTHATNELDTILQIGDVCHDKLPVKDNNPEPSSDSPSDDDGSSDSKDENASNNDLNMGDSTTMASKCLQKSATFSVSTSSERNGLESQLHDSTCRSRSLSMPTVRKLVSAIKGSREKEGLPQKKLSVSWTPDVYDPLPTSVSHFPKKNQPSKSHKKHGKGKQKGKNMRGGGSGPKEKKHHHKSSSGRSGRCSDSYSDTEKAQNYQSSLESLDFNDPVVGGAAPEANCGSKLLGQASGTMHCVY